MKSKTSQNTNRKAQLRRESYETSSKVNSSRSICMHSTIFEFVLNSIFLPQISHGLDFNLLVILSAISRASHIGSREKSIHIASNKSL